MATSMPSVETILAEAVEIGDEASRNAYLDVACGGDARLRAELDRLVRNHFLAGDFLEIPVCSAIAGPGASDAGLADVADDVSGTTVGPYRLLERIGQGGMGQVYVAEQASPVKRRVALKIVRAGMDSRQIVARFEAERQALALMDHPHIARVFDGGTTATGRSYFVMELVRGLSITEYCDRARLDLRQRIALFLPVCDAIRHAHNKGVIHRDLKPSNVLVTLLDGKPVPKVIDFGIAKALNQRLSDATVYTGFLQILGTPAYMSPEQVELSGLDIDTRSDVYSLGVLLYELLTGTTPFEADELTRGGLDGMRRMIRETEPRRPSQKVSSLGDEVGTTTSQKRGLDLRQLERGLAGELDWIVVKALEKDRTRRYQSPSELADDLRRYLNDEPVRACPPTWHYRVAKFARRHRVGLATSAIVAVALVLGVAVSLWQAVVATEARRVADVERRRAEDSFEQAMAAVERLLSRLGDTRLREVPQMEQVRAEVLQDAVQLFERLLSQSPSDPGARLRTARARLQFVSALDLLGADESRRDAELSRALEELGRLHAEQPGQALVARLLAQAHLRHVWHASGNSAETEAHLRMAIDGLRPLARGSATDAETVTSLANALRTLGGRLSLSGRDAEAEPLLGEALALCDDAPEASDDVRASTLHHRALRAFLDADYPPALEAIDEAIAARKQALESRTETALIRSELVLDLTLKGRLLVRMGRMQDAVAPLEQATALVDALIRDFPRVPKYRRMMPYVRHQLVEALARLKRREEAVAHIRIAEPLYGKDLDDWIMLESDWALVGNHERIVEIDRALLADNPNDRGRLRSLALALLNLDRIDEARPVIQRLIERHPNHSDTWKLASDLAAEDSRWDAAEDAANRAIALEPTESYLYKRRSYARQQQGHIPDALADLRKALELDASDLTALFWFEKKLVEENRALREGLLALADWLVEKTKGEPRAVVARERLRKVLGEEAETKPSPSPSPLPPTEPAASGSEPAKPSGA